jgi:hypothetical protein
MKRICLVVVILLLMLLVLQIRTAACGSEKIFVCTEHFKWDESKYVADFIDHLYDRLILDTAVYFNRCHVVVIQKANICSPDCKWGLGIQVYIDAKKPKDRQPFVSIMFADIKAMTPAQHRAQVSSLSLLIARELKIKDGQISYRR